ncbi:hypothetical protein B0A55_04666 [Friedmanniomyces simplex]|uniref:Uncharacterized protein n=1 Tax=Friedmanniomyces simplex TaxID=329884 RepID=A0A4V5NIG6_9PEZI|nr:hypothetical protein B0A55_04666 [Friedmanniomyces simplex]
MSLTQTYYIASTARSKLGQEAGRADHNLRLLVGHSNLLDQLMVDLADAKTEQEARFNQSVRKAPKPEKPRHSQWIDLILEEVDEDGRDAESDEGSDYDEDAEIYDMMPTIKKMRSLPVTVSSMEVEEDVEEDYDEKYDDERALIRVASKHSPPELTHDSDPDSDDDRGEPPHLELDRSIADRDAARVSAELARVRTQYPQPNATFNTGLRHAIECEQFGIVSLLLESGIQPNDRNLQAAVIRGNIPILARLMEDLLWTINTSDPRRVDSDSGFALALFCVLELLDRADEEVDVGLLVEDEVELVFVLELLDRADEEVDVGLLVEDEVELVFVVFVLELLDRIDRKVDVGLLVEDEVELVFVLELLDRVEEEVDVGLLMEDEVELVFVVLMLELLDRVDEEVDVGLLVEDEVELVFDPRRHERLHKRRTGSAKGQRHRCLSTLDLPTWKMHPPLPCVCAKLINNNGELAGLKACLVSP